MTQLPFRQIHLDFHTSEAIPGIGSEWDAKHFQEMLQRGHVNSITVFAKCHHGWSYHPTQVPLSQMHPNLKFDLLAAMINAAHEIGVQTPIYISAGLDEKLVRTHSHWIRRNESGITTWAGWTDAGYHEFCFRSPYLDYLIAQTEEVVRNYDGEGIFLDIVGVRECYCQYCLSEMLKRGMDPNSREDRMTLGRETYLNYLQRINTAIHAIKPEMRIFHNSGHITRGDREIAHENTHLELESLPTGGWGYDHFPLSARYAQGLGMEFLGMTGKFHTSWGEFGGYKHPNALRYETALSLANGAKISIGDQMHPFGKLDPATYALIGTAYAEVEAKEPWCDEATSVADVAVLSFESVSGVAQSNGPATKTGMIDAGVVRVLLEGHILFDVVDTESDFSQYKVLVLPDAIPADAKLVEHLKAYLQQGGKIFVTGDSLLDAEKGKFALDLGVDYQGKSPFSPEYLVPEFTLANWENAAFVMYTSANKIACTRGTVLATRQEPFFNREFKHFCSHQHAPNTKVAAGPMMVGTDNTVYLAIPAFQLYAEKGQNVLREILLHALRTLLTEPTLVTNLPAQGVQTVMRQQEQGRTIVHLLYANPVKRGQGIEVIEDIVPLHDTSIALRINETPKRVYLAPQQTELPFNIENGVLKATLPVLNCHQMVVVE